MYKINQEVMKTVKFRKCRICKKKVSKDYDLHIVLTAIPPYTKKFYHLSCYNPIRYSDQKR